MELTNDFRVALPVERAWAVLTDLERIAPCMPGAQLQEVEGDEYRGIVKIKVGPITAQYKGQATFLERDESKRVAVLRAEGRETRGQGNANATITATLTPDGDGTAVSVVTDLTVTGRVAQFGRGVLADISAKLLDQFVESLEKMVLADDPATTPAAAASSATKSAPKWEPETAPAPETATDPAAAASTQTATAKAPPTPPAADADDAAVAANKQPALGTPQAAAPLRRIDSPEPEPVNLLDAAGSPLAKRVGPVLVAVALAWLLRKLVIRVRK